MSQWLENQANLHSIQEKWVFCQLIVPLRQKSCSVGRQNNVGMQLQNIFGILTGSQYLWLCLFPYTVFWCIENGAYICSSISNLFSRYDDLYFLYYSFKSCSQFGTFTSVFVLFSVNFGLIPCNLCQLQKYFPFF
jgi:hypothetical protein